jgi:hypothetical protein
MKHELECLLHYLKWLQKCGNSEERIKQGLEYLYEFDLFGEETYNGWLWEDMPETAQETLQHCINKVEAFLA